MNAIDKNDPHGSVCKSYQRKTFTDFQIAFLILVSLFLYTNPAAAQKKIYILTDLEGVSGVYKFAQTREKDTPLNIQACEYFMDDLSAVIRGLKDGGATEILVIDGHGNQCVIPHMMEPGVKYLTGIPRPSVYWGLDSSWVGMVQFGAHAMNGTEDGVLHHTMSSKSEMKYWYNGVEVGEVVQVATIAGYYGIPTILVTGDEAVCRETTNFLGKSCVTVAVKKGIAREAAILYPFEETVKNTDDDNAIIEKIDIGGIALIRAAAKNCKDVSGSSPLINR